MIARSRLVGNFLSHCAVHRQLTRVVGLNQSVRLQSTNGDPDMNFTLKLPPDGISVEHSNEKSLDGSNLRVTLNISVLHSNKSVPESEQSNKQLKNLNETHYVVGQRITNEIPMEEKKEDGILQRSEPQKTRVFSRFIKTVNYKNRDLETKNSSQLEDENPMEKMAEDERDVSKSTETHKNQNLDSKNQIHRKLIAWMSKTNDSLLVIDGLSVKISEDDIRDYFSRFGDIKRCNHDFADRTTYIHFNLPNSVQHVLNCGPYYFIDDKITYEIEPKTSKSMTPPKDELTLSLGILPPNTTLDSIRELFIKYNVGQVAHVQFEYNKIGNVMINKTGYVTFATKEQLDEALEYQPYYLDRGILSLKPKKDIAIPDVDDKCTNDDDEIDSDDDGTIDGDEYHHISDYGDEYKDIDDDESESSFCDNTILVKNLPKGATDEEIQKIFSEFGKLTDWGIKSGGSYGWVSFARPINVSTLEDKSPTMYGKKLKIEPFERE